MQQEENLSVEPKSALADIKSKFQGYNKDLSDLLNRLYSVGEKLEVNQSIPEKSAKEEKINRFNLGHLLDFDKESEQMANTIQSMNNVVYKLEDLLK